MTITTPVLLVRATIPGLPPSVNHTYMSSGKGRVFKARTVTEWQEMATLILRSKRRAGAPWDGKACFLLILGTKDRRRMDCDNREKAIQDCLEPAGVIADDSQIWTHATRRRIRACAETEIYVWTGTDLPEGVMEL